MATISSAPHFHAHGKVVVRWINFDHIAAHAESAAAKVFGALVLNFNQLAKNSFASHGLSLFDQLHHAVIGFRGAETVNARHRGDHDDVAAFEQRTRGGHAQLVELIVDGGFFFDVSVARRNVSFGLVVIVIADEIFHGVVGEKRAKFVIKLRGQSFVVRQDDSGAIDLLDHLGHGERFARTSDAEEDLVAVSVINAANQIGNRFGLVAARLVVTGNLEVHRRTLSCEKWVKLKTTIIPKVAKRRCGPKSTHDGQIFRRCWAVDGASAGNREISDLLSTRLT